MVICVKLYRRCIIRHFGGIKNCFIFCFSLFLTIYLMDQYVFNKENVLAYQGKGKSSSKNENIRPVVNKPEPQAPPEDNPVPKLPKLVVPETVKPVEPKTPTPVEDMRSRKCGTTATCTDGKYTYYVKSGVGRDGLPTVCFNGFDIMSPAKKNADRGINVVVINDKTLALEDVRTFDVYVGDAVFLRYLKLGIQEGHLVFLVTLDEASYNMRDETRSLLKLFGSSLIDKLKFRDNFVMIGQKGLATGKAIEKFLARDQGKDFGEPVEISGCLSIPLGKLEKVPLNPEDQKAVDVENNVKLGEAMENCGIFTECGASAFSVQLYTGHENKDMLKMCVNGKYVFGQNLNDAGRGLNIAVVNPVTKEVYRIGHFDTFEADTSNLELFLEIIGEADIILVVSHDEASTNINLNIQKEFQLLGSQFISKLSFRDAWIFVGQRGIVGKSPIEEISYAGSNWPRPIDKKLCVPTALKGIPVNSSESNTKRQQFCRRYRDNSDFCAGSKIDLSLSLTVLKDKGLEGNEIFKVPIIVVPPPSGCQYSDFRLQLESLLLIPGLNRDVVMVFFTETSLECGELADVFNFRTNKMNPNASYESYIQLALERAWIIFGSAEYLIILEENVIPSPDILSLFGQCFPVLKLDESLIGITAWNENGFDGTSSRPDLVYRAESFPGLGFLLKKSFYNEFMRGKLNACCSSRSWIGWLHGKFGDKEMLVPDVSRAFMKSPSSSGITGELFGRQRVTSLEDVAKISDVSRLTKTGYEDEINKLIESSTALATTDSTICLKGSGLGFTIPETEGKVYSIYYEQTDAKDQSTLSLLAKCFQLFYVKNQPVRGTHHGLLRFSYKKNVVFLIGSATEYYKHKPSNHQPVPGKVPAK